MTIKNKNKIYKDIILMVNQALNNFNIVGWDIIQLFQPIKQTSLKPTLYIQILNQKNYGWQFSDDLMENNEYIHKEQYIQQFDIKISAFLRRKATDTLDTLNSSDLLEYIKSYFLSQKGIRYARGLGYNIFNPVQIDNTDLVDDSDNFEFLPSLTFTLTINQSWNSPQNTISKINGIINKI